MKAVILAAGKGTRLKEFTKKIPKPMIIFNDKPILEYNVDLCKRFGVNEIYMNSHHLKEVITDYFGNGEKFGVKINYSYEEKLLGTSGSLNNFKDFLADKPFFVLYGDNISDFDLNLLKDKFRQTKALAVIGFHFREDVSHSGVAEFDEEDRILKFIEKPQPGMTESKWVNAGVYLLAPEIFDFIPEGFSDFAKDIFPELLKECIPIYGVKQVSDVKVFDTPEMLIKAMGRRE